MSGARAAIVIPILDESAHLDHMLTRLLRTMPQEITSVWLVDGGSSDGSDRIARAAALRDPRVMFRTNPDRIQARAVNLVAREIVGTDGVDFLIRMDAHAEYGDDFCAIVLDRLAAREADSVVVPMRTVGGNRWQNAAARVFNSWVGTGNNPHRVGGSGWVEHGHHAGLRLSTFVELGGYDETFVANEDQEYDMRLIGAGGRIYLEPDATINYVPRDSVAATFRQYRRNGRWRGRTLRKHRRLPTLRQVAPTIMMIVEVIAILLALRRPWRLAILVPVLHALGVLTVVRSVIPGRQLQEDIDAAAIALAAHVGAGLGLMASLTDDRSPDPVPSRLEVRP